MIIIKLMGGLGNQMFQYATARALAYARGVPLRLDAGEFQNGNVRKFKLDKFHLAASIISCGELDAFKQPARSASNSFINKLRPYYRQRLIEESRFSFDPNILRAPRNVYLNGYWQSEKYFKSIEQLLRSEFRFKSEPSGLNAELAQRIKENPSAVSIHIRRGDYVSDSATSRVHGTCSIEYYELAQARLVALGIEPQFFVFSDDISWSQANLRLEHPATFVAHNGADFDYEDLRLMSMCRHHVIANSSFSWWGAWLSSAADKIVIAPRKWFNNAGHDTCDLIPDSWLQL